VPAVRASVPARSTSPTDYVLLAEVVCVVGEDDELDTLLGAPLGAAPEPGRGSSSRPRGAGTVFPWFLGPADGSVVAGAVDARAGRAGPEPLVIDSAPEPPEPPGPLFEPTPDAGPITTR
jgi:hypothetical protein